MKKSYIDQYGCDSLQQLQIAAEIDADIFVTSNAEMLKDWKILEKKYKVKIREPREMSDE